MFKILKKPVTSTVAQALLWILLLSIATTSFAIFTLASSLNDAEAVNVAGSMRMQSYRLAYDIQSHSLDFELHVEQFEQSLFSPSMSALKHWTVPEDIQTDYVLIIQRWEQLNGLLLSQQNDVYLTQVADFVEQIDEFVFDLQEHSEQKLIALSWIGGVGLGGILIISTFVVRYVRREVVNPLNRLSHASEQIQKRNFNVSLHVSGDNELSRLTHTFNSMARELGELYFGLERAVGEKTHRLRHANDSLQVLYNCSQALNVSRITRSHIETVVGYLFSLEGIAAVKLTVGIGKQSEVIRQGEPKDYSDWHRLPLTLDEQELGTLEVQYMLPCPDKELIDSICQVLTQGIYYSQTQKQEEYLLLMEERATIARELHDSLAQSLSYLRIQVSLLKRALGSSSPAKQEAIPSVIVDIDSGLSAAYTQLRELLNTFRLNIKDADFDDALKQMVIPLQEQTEAKIVIQNEVASLNVQANEQVHVLQLIREAVLNAVKHAEATKISVHCRKKDNEISVAITDDGVGFDVNHHKINHYGLSIMEERAARLNGHVSVKSTPGEGCHIQLNYTAEESINDDM
ncbi:nitrate/nitrite two-component system sensor histidine kinase NarQ [Vibrio sp. SCSIO 43132]|uniref:nitrate/nitrite two-component system sensor histidine kinase NarQ n=1 Tax=Vibrio sp. SCSIO 43132 TaxID=2779363 RepID=UPI001CA95F14|nr:nitrate/nitrite two-component system sensor histidine kinase NarQ [Vibrio sp. SCSIO 43132]UAB72540.1 nitrate/nitrite two-component system sensor histidine kinase NarQ [Vibrio sp. SCSIO 43132]